MDYDTYREKIDNMQDLISNSLGFKEAYTELCKALSYDQKQDLFAYIIRMHDLGEAGE